MVWSLRNPNAGGRPLLGFLSGVHLVGAVSEVQLPAGIWLPSLLTAASGGRHHTVAPPVAAHQHNGAPPTGIQSRRDRRHDRGDGSDGGILRR